MRTTQLARIRAPSLKTFENRFLRRHQPVIITNLFEGQPISSLSKLSRAVSVLKGVKLGIRQEYFSEIAEVGVRPTPPPRMMTVSDYMQLVRREPRTKWMCTEFTTPPELTKLFRLPEYCSYNYAVGGIVSRWFFGNRGNVAHLHFDGDQRHVLLSQVTGRKRVILFSPGIARLLNPVSNTGTLMLETMSEREKSALIRHLGGYDGTLNPGETIYIPPLMWHHIEYTDTGISFNLRFGLAPESKLLAKLETDYLVQNIAWHILRQKKLTGPWLRAFRLIRREWNKPFEDPFEKYVHIERLLEGIYERLCTDSLQGKYWLPHRSMIEAHWRLGATRQLQKRQAAAASRLSA